MISQQICEEMLQEHGVKPTANRIVVVKALADAERPLSLSELEYKIMSIDKSGVFRALASSGTCHRGWWRRGALRVMPQPRWS